MGCVHRINIIINNNNYNNALVRLQVKSAVDSVELHALELWITSAEAAVGDEKVIRSDPKYRRNLTDQFDLQPTTDGNAVYVLFFVKLSVSSWASVYVVCYVYSQVLVSPSFRKFFRGWS